MLLAVVAFDPPGAAQTYKWVDEKGTVHFSNDPPAKAPVEVLPDADRRPMVKNGPPSAEGSEAESVDEEAPTASQPGAASALAPEDHPGETVGDEPDTVIVDDGNDPVTRYRANSPRNQPGQPIRQPARPSRRAR